MTCGEASTLVLMDEVWKNPIYIQGNYWPPTLEGD